MTLPRMCVWERELEWKAPALKKKNPLTSACVCLLIQNWTATRYWGSGEKKKGDKILSLHAHNIVYGSYKTLIYDDWQKRKNILWLI